MMLVLLVQLPFGTSIGWRNGIKILELPTITLTATQSLEL
jgi:hypothetical protein